ncbi:MAG: hypothetical protein ACM34J_07040 [Ignavibacteria bacterium]
MKAVIGFMILTISIVAGKLAYDEFFNDPEIAAFEESKWRHRDYLGVKFESPFELSKTEVELPKYIKPFVKYMDVYKYERKALCLVISKSEYIENMHVDLNGAVKGMMNSLKADDDITGVTYKTAPISKHYLTGRKITGKFKMNGKDAVISGELYKSGSRLLQVLLTNLDYPENHAAGERIMNSMRIQL